MDAILAAVDSPAAVLNTRHEVAKEKGWKAKAPSKTAFRTAVLQDNNLLRRPIVLRGKRLVVGKDLDGIRALLG